MSRRNTLFFTLAAVLGLLSACAAPPEAALTAPPELTVTAGDQSCTALRGGWDRMPGFEGECRYSFFALREGT